MVKTYRRLVIVCAIPLLILLLAACSTSGSGSNTTGNTTTSTTVQQQGQGNGPGNGNTPTTAPQHQQGNTAPTVIVGTAAPSSSPGVGPIVILSPTPVPGNAHGQLVTLPDRTLVISNVSKVAGADSSSTGISLTISVKDTGTKSILNQASFYQLVVAEGDSFGLQTGTNSSFFGNIAPQASRNGTLVFQVPTAALVGIRLLFRSEIAAETVFIPLNV
jgi:hypothetical protein